MRLTLASAGSVSVVDNRDILTPMAVIQAAPDVPT